MKEEISPELWRRMDPIIDEVLDLDSSEQEVRVKALCDGDNDLLEDVLSFLGASRNTTGFLEDSAGEQAVNLVDESTRQWDPAERLQQRLGPYRLVEVLGEGGMGVVYLAERADGQFQKKVAIKLMLSLSEGSSLRDRFLNERQLLARLEHPNITRLLDGGISEDGFPYIVMELVEGLPLVQYARKNRLNLDQRLELFLSVCEAVDSAHQQFVLHCDLKPSNILVTEKGQVRLLDFGISCCLEKAGISVLNNQAGNLLTPDFASPEQLEGSGLTTATDIFSLGVLLYDLITGGRPFDSEFELIPDKPMLPSQAGSKMPWAGRLKGDLDNILLTMLKKDPSDRYNSVQEVVDDLRRFREFLPVRVTPATPLYLLRKIMGRNKALSLVVLVAWMGLMGAVFSTTRSARIAKQERDVARQENLKSEAVSSFLVELFKNSDPNEKPAESVTARELLDQGTAHIRTNLADQPQVQGELMFTMANVYANLGLYHEAGELNDEVLGLLEGSSSAETAKLASAYTLQGHIFILQGDYSSAAESARMAVALNRESKSPGGSNLAGSLHVLAHALKEQGRMEESETIYRESLAEWRRPAHPDSLELASALVSFGEMLRVARRPQEAESLEREALQMSRIVVGDTHPLMLDCLNNLALTVRDLKQYEEAETLTLEAMELTRKIFSPESMRMAIILNNLGALYKLQGKLDEAEDVHRQALAIRRVLLEPDHPALAGSLNNLAVTLEVKGNLKEAAELLHEALIIVREARGERHLHVGVSLYNLAKVYFKDERFAAVDSALAEGYGIMVETVPAGNWVLGNAQSMWGYALAKIGELSEGYDLVLAGYEGVLASRGAEDPRTESALRRLAEVCQWQGKVEEAMEYQVLLGEGN